MPIYWLLVAGFGVFAVCLTTFSNVYWVGALLVVTGGLVGDCLPVLFADAATGTQRQRKWLLVSMGLVCLGVVSDVALLSVPGVVGLFGLLFSHIASSLEVLRVSRA